MSVRAAQVAHALATRERQIAKALEVEGLLEQQPTHHGYALNVKVHDAYCECDVEERYRGIPCDCGYDEALRAFWRDATEIAQSYGFKNAYSAGRQGGWLVPEPQPRTDDMWPEQVEEWERGTFAPFMQEIAHALDVHRRAWANR